MNWNDMKYCSYYKKDSKQNISGISNLRCFQVVQLTREKLSIRADELGKPHVPRVTRSAGPRTVQVEWVSTELI